MRIPRSGLLLIAAVLTACNDPIAPILTPDQVSLSFSYWESPFTDAADPRVVSGTGQVAILGAVENQGATLHCGPVTASVWPYADDMLTVYITQDYAPSSSACPRRYELVIQGMPAGRHRLRLVQRQDDLDWGLETIFFEGVVRVR